MKVLSLLQPRASLVVTGEKKIETRSWNTKYRGQLLIHASKKYTDEQKDLGKRFTLKYGLRLRESGAMPVGQIIGSVDLIGTSTTEFYLDCKKGGIPLTEQGGDWEKEIAFGDYSSGRFGWLLSKPIQFKTPIPAKGSLGLWEYNGRLPPEMTHERACRICGCTDRDCRQCVEKTGRPCYWVESNLCSACASKIF